MKIFKLLGIAQSSLLKNRTRSILTMLGIIIGVGAVIVMVAIGEGTKENIETRINSLGTNLIMIRSASNSAGGVRRGFGSSRTLLLKDEHTIREQCDLVMAVSGIVNVNGQIIGGGSNWSSSVMGVSPDYTTIKSWELDEGTFFTERDIRAKTKVAVVGTSIRDNLFGGGDVIGQSIRIQSVPFKIIGLLKSKGSTGSQDQDDVVLVPLTTAAFRLRGDSKYVSQIYVSATSMDMLDAAQEEVSQTLRMAHKLIDGEDDDFNLTTQTELTEAFTSSTETMTTLLAWIAAISLFVGGIGVMNIMLVSVTERTREIGIRVAVGARGFDVMMQFLIEAVVLSLFGGLTGIAMSFGVCRVLTDFAGMTTIIQTDIIFISLGVSGLIGIFFGLFPAKKASELDPIDALRHE
ncbi:MAG: FtsX-like permease family protein [Opitutales bacterium]|jgi:putative ABC transport system permease protein|nr:FtsX-like permease family protein [Opitutales bacterium]MBT5170129.1 FtsX-like permease family protein [Opitutales bacterium]MBT5815708.1 FtsX-like permease family protein [Opitutales bacterium]MBT6381395.1 FtsX-like permease family protein [Opitutales bacterium]MBT7867586.1 FtsX-like permease family protein [Opitutales bacterium]